MAQEQSTSAFSTKGRQRLMTAFSEQMPTPANYLPGSVQGHWTYKEYAALPDDGKRYEIIDGVIYRMPSPASWHQNAVIMLVTYLTIHVKFAGRGKVYVAPFDVELSPNVVVQPDVLVILNEHVEIIKNSHVIGSPDLVVEVASPGTSKYDRREKYRAYARAGIREYWIVDPIQQTVEILRLDDGIYHCVGIYKGEDTLPSVIVPDFPVQVGQLFA